MKCTTFFILGLCLVSFTSCENLLKKDKNEIKKIADDFIEEALDEATSAKG